MRNLSPDEVRQYKQGLKQHPIEPWLRAMDTEQLIERLDLYEWTLQGCEGETRHACADYFTFLSTKIREVLSDREQLRRTLGVGAKQHRTDLRQRFDAAKKSISITEFLFEQGVDVSHWREGRRYAIVCPLGLHDDSTPSFTVYENDRGFYCFGCNQGGSIIDLAMLMLRTNSPVEALEGLQQVWKDQRPPGLMVRR